MATWNILLDFDKTVAEGHSGGHRFEEDYPMGEENKHEFLENLQTWLSTGHNVAIITRGIDDAIGPYFEEILGIVPTLNDYEKGKLSIYAPDESTFASHNSGCWWAAKKTKFVAELLGKIGADPEGTNSIFLDDTEDNVQAMDAWFPKMVSLVAGSGEYQETYATVNRVISGGPAEINSGAGISNSNNNSNGNSNSNSKGGFRKRKNRTRKYLH